MAKLTVALPEVDDVREAMQQAIADHLEISKSGSGNDYFTLPGRQIPLTVGGVSGTFACSFYALKDASKVEERRAATVASTADSLIAKMTPAEKEAWVKKLMADL